MNGAEPNIEIFRPFGAAFELMKKVLFQPFDLKKWFIIGFAAWLANLGRGGVSFNYQFNRREEAQKVKEAISQIPHPILVLGISLLVVFGLVLIVLFSWLRARGGFTFIDCVVKNRAVIAEPWREFRKEGNSYFLFSLVVTFVLIVFAALFALPLIVLAFKGRYFLYLHRDRLDVYVILIIAAWIFVILLVIIAWALIASFMVPVMYRRRCRAYEAFRAVLSLIAAHPGEILLYCLFLVVLAIATGLISCFAICATCCIAALPYIGTVILLPVFILFRSFSLVFLRQFGPDYDVWVTFMPPEFAPALSGVPPTPPAAQPPNLPPEPPSSPVG
jgi:MFS family permease